MDGIWHQTRKDKKFLFAVTAITIATFFLVLVQNIIRYGIHESYDPWRSVIYLIVSLVLILPFIPYVIRIGLALLKYSDKMYWLYLSPLAIIFILLYFVLASITLHMVGFYEEWMSSKYARQYFGREAFYHMLIIFGTVYYVYHRYHNKQEKLVKGTIGRKEITLKADLVKWIEADDHYLKIHLEDGELIKRATMEQMTEDLKPGFVRIHRKYLVNRRAIIGKEKKQRDEFVILKSGERLKVGRSYIPVDVP